MNCSYQNNVCSKCDMTYKLINNNCVPFICNANNCKTCYADNLCLDCLPGYILSDYSNNGLCVLSPVANCRICSGASSCSSCTYC